MSQLVSSSVHFGHYKKTVRCIKRKKKYNLSCWNQDGPEKFFIPFSQCHFQNELHLHLLRLHYWEGNQRKWLDLLDPFWSKPAEYSSACHFGMAMAQKQFECNMVRAAVWSSAPSFHKLWENSWFISDSVCESNHCCIMYIFFYCLGCQTPLSDY